MIRTYKNKTAAVISFLAATGFMDKVLPSEVISMDDAQAALLTKFLEETNEWKCVTLEQKTDESQNSSSTTAVTLTYDIASVDGVWLATDAAHALTNYFTGGSFSGKVLTLGSALPAAVTAVIVNYKALQSRIGLAGGVITKTLTISDIDTPKSVSLVLTTTASTMPAGCVITMTVKNTAGSTVETRTRTLGALASTSETVKFYPTKAALLGDISFSIAYPQAVGAAYTVKTLVTLNTPKAVPAGATFTIGTEGGNKINVQLQLQDSAGVDLTNEGEVDIVVCTDQEGLTTASTVEGIAIKGGGKGVIRNSLVTNQAAHVISAVDGIIDFEIEETTGAADYFLKVIFPDGTKAVSDMISFT